MIKRIVIWTVKGDDQDQVRANAQRIKVLLDSIKGKIPGMPYLEVGVNIRSGADQCHVAFTTHFNDQASLAAYDHHPSHEAIKHEVGSLRKDRYVVLYESDD